MQEMVKEVTLKTIVTMHVQFLHGIISLLNYNFLINPFSFDAYQSYNYTIIIMQVIATKSIHIIIQELMNLLYGNKFSPWEDFFVNPFGSDVISPNQLCKCTYTGAGRSTAVEQ